MSQTLRYGICTTGTPPVLVAESNHLEDAISKCQDGQEVWDWATNEVVYPKYPFVKNTNKGSWVVYARDHAVKVDSKRIRAARYALLTADEKPASEDFQDWQTRYMEPLRNELRDARAERTNELMPDNNPASAAAPLETSEK